MIEKSTFKPAWWLNGPHLQTLWPTFFRRQPKIATVRERIELPDGDFIDLDWGPHRDGPLVLILHGLGGSIDSPYARGILKAMTDLGWQAVFMHFRGCSGEPNRFAHSYHCGETGDVHYIVELLRKRFPGRDMGAIGFSLGGNVLLKWLGETGHDNPLIGAVAVSVPFYLPKTADHMSRGLIRLYQWWMVRCLYKIVKQKQKIMKLPVNVGDVSSLKSFWEFDDKVTAPLHGFKDVYDYYAKGSCSRYLKNIDVNTLILHAIDDPLMTPEDLVAPESLSDKLTLEVSDSGGHVGFVGGKLPWRPQYWLEKRIPEYFKQFSHHEHRTK